ncbi:MAG TPA: phospholipid scramblase-related protein [Candidatus Omnitrophota bacterium]|jgi:hypothetical protein|nr:MAG: Scramblase [Candidatus Omnitrophica bacterium ADurb.Bin314]HOE69303.1 phospholipid scramblase-related protein [Candidatus Omnitrophota bacterium]HQB93956.1 phospholipid scramblase-related protein [Candidatus Omnitrophota bacterium]
MEHFAGIEVLTIREKGTYASLPPAWTAKPECCLADGGETERFYLFSGEGEQLGFPALREARTLTLYLTGPGAEEVLYFEKKTGLLGFRMDVYNAKEQLIGSVQKSQKSIRSSYEISDGMNRLFFLAEGPAIMPESFVVLRQDQPAGKISRRLAKTAEEGVYRQDHFSLVFPMGIDTREKGALVGALILIDLLH